MTSFTAIAITFCLFATAAFGQSPQTVNPPDQSPADGQVIRLWSGAAPGAMGTADIDIPTLTVALPSNVKPTGAVFIVCPGGGYEHLAPHEGLPIARWLNSLGVTGFVLKYRLGPKYHHPVEMDDVQRAIRLVRFNAKKWNLDPDRIGVIGFSAGGHLASTAATHFDEGHPNATDPIDRTGCRPDLAILVYPVIAMVGPYTHVGSRRNLLGDHPKPSLEKFLSSDLQVSASTPPCFLVHAADDPVVPVQNSLLFTNACLNHHVPVELHIFEHGPHGFGLGTTLPEIKVWPRLAATWLQRHGFAAE